MADKVQDTRLGSPFFEDGVIKFKNEKGEVCVNIFEVALQAMAGSLVMEPYDNGFSGLMPRYYDINYLPAPPRDDHAKKAVSFLMNNKKENGPGVFWEYDYDVVFRGSLVAKAPWVSAFGQAYAILALVYWYRVTGENAYLETAVKAAKFLEAPVEKGGLTSLFEHNGRDVAFFEELPSNPTHIINAHLVSLISIIELSKNFDGQPVEGLLRKGLESLETMLPVYDTGYWSRYDIPEEVFALFRLSLEGVDEVAVSEIKFILGHKESGLDVSDDSAYQGKGFYLSGIDWNGRVSKDGCNARRMINGRRLRTQPVPTGTIQNTYIYFNIKDYGKYLKEDGSLFFNISLFSEGPGKLIFEHRDIVKTDALEFMPLSETEIKKGWNNIRFPIRLKEIGSELSDAYHRFHTDLLKIIARECGSKCVKKHYRAFDSYLRTAEFKRVFGETKFDLMPEDYPDAAFVSINSSCGLACRMCDIGIKDPDASLFKHLKGATRNMGLEDYRKMLLNMKGKVKRIAFIGTEALMHPEILEFLELAKENGFQVQLTTNGIRLKDFYKDILGKVDSLWISLDGVDEVHDKLRGRAGLFREAVECIRSIGTEKERNGGRGPGVFINYTIVPPLNHLEMPRFLDFFHENGLKVDSVTFSHLNFITEGCSKAHNLAYPGLPVSESKYLRGLDLPNVDYLEFHKTVLEASRKASKYKIPVSFIPHLNGFNSLVDFYLHPDVPLGRKMCTVPWSAIEVDPAGNLSVAGRCFQAHMGNICAEPIEKIWRGRQYVEIRELLLQKGALGPCSRCCGIL